MKLKVKMQYLNRKEILFEEFKELAMDYISATAGLNTLGQYFFKNKTKDLFELAVAIGLDGDLMDKMMDFYHKSIIEGFECTCGADEKECPNISNDDGSIKVPDILNG